MKTPNSKLQGNNSLANGSKLHLTAPNGSPNGLSFCKCLITRNIDGFTGKTPLGTLPPHGPDQRLVELHPSSTDPAQSSPVEPSPAQSSHPLPSLFQQRPTCTCSSKFGLRNLFASWLVLGVLFLATASPAIARNKTPR